MLGHDGPPTAVYKEHLILTVLDDSGAITGKPLERCPLRSLQLADPELVAEVERHLNEYFPFYEDGHLLVAGGISDQPARTVAYMLEIRRLWGIVDEKHLATITSNGEGAE